MSNQPFGHGWERSLERLAISLRTAAWRAGAGIYLGVGAGGWSWAGREHSTLVLGPSRSGKTSSLVIPNVLAAPGSVVSASTKPDVMYRTAQVRGMCGWTLLYDPSGTVEAPEGVVRIGWSPVHAASDWDGALAIADSMCRSARSTRSGTRGADGDHWSERATALLAPVLHAAALEERPMSTVLHWVDRHDGAPALSVLAKQAGERAPATDVLAGILSTDSREQSGIWSTASGILSAYRYSGVLASTMLPPLDAEAFCEGANTLYLCTSGEKQQQFAPLVVGVLHEIRRAAYRRAACGRALPPVLLALDEVANIAPVPDLPSMVSEGAGQGLLTLASLQDLSQARRQWGSEADAFISLFGTTIVLSGIADIPTVEAISTLAGEVEVPTRSIGVGPSADGRLRSSVTYSTVLRRRLAPDAVARGMQGAAIAIDATNRIGWVRLTPAHSFPPWSELSRPMRSIGDRLRSSGISPNAVGESSFEREAGPGGHPSQSKVEKATHVSHPPLGRQVVGEPFSRSGRQR